MNRDQAIKAIADKMSGQNTHEAGEERQNPRSCAIYEDLYQREQSHDQPIEA